MSGPRSGPPPGPTGLLLGLGLLRQAEHPLADDVVEDLVGPPGHAHAGQPEHELGPGVGAPFAAVGHQLGAEHRGDAARSPERMLAVSESLAIDISGPGSWPVAILAMARRLVNDATRPLMMMSASCCRMRGSSLLPWCRTSSISRCVPMFPPPPLAIPPPMAARSFMSVVRATVHPSFTSPSRWRSGIAHLGEEHLVERGPARHLPQRPDLHPGRVHVDDETGQALVLGGVGIRPADDLADVRQMGPRGPHLLAGHHPLVAVPHRLGLQAGQVAARPRAR